MDVTELIALRGRHKEVVVKPEVIRLFLDKIIAVQVARRLTDIHDQPEGVRNMFREVKKLIIIRMGLLHPTRSMLGTQPLLSQLRLSLLDQAEREYRQERPETFICFYDTADGIDKALMLLIGVLYELCGVTDYRERVKQTGPRKFYKPEDVDEYLWAKRENWAERIVAAIDRLKQEPSGFSLLDEGVAEAQEFYKTQPNGELMIAGAQMAQKIYKALYPLTEGI